MYRHIMVDEKGRTVRQSFDYLPPPPYGQCPFCKATIWITGKTKYGIVTGGISFDGAEAKHIEYAHPLEKICLDYKEVSQD